MNDLNQWLLFLETVGVGETMGARIQSLGGFNAALRLYRDVEVIRD